MIGKVEFIRCAGSIATSEYPLITSDADMDQYVVYTYGGVPLVEDLQQTLTLPTFDGWSDCNMVRLTQKDEASGATPWKAYYWITGAIRSSNVQSATIFNLEFNPVTTLLKKGDSVNGLWVRSPVNFTPWIQQNVASGTMGLMKQIPLMKEMPKNIAEMSTLWVSVTASRTPFGADGSYEIYGFPIYARSLQMLYSDFDTRIYAKDSSGNERTFPALQDLFHGETLTALGLPPSAIIDISITPYMPFECEFVEDSTSGTYRQYFKTTGIYPMLIVYTDDTTKYSKYAVYNITSYEIVNASLVNKTSTTTFDTLYATAGQYSIMRGDGSLLAQIPANWMSKTSDDTYSLKIRSQVICDFSQILYRIEVLKVSYDEDEGESEALGYFVVPGVHIPYMGTAWDDYRAYSMANDREAMQFSINQAKTQAITNIADAAINTVVGVATAGASYAAGTAVRVASGANSATMNAADVAYQQQQGSTIGQGASGIVGAVVGYMQAEKSAKFNQAMTEKKVQSQPGNAYNASDGLFNLYMEMNVPLCLAVSLPVNLTQAKFNQFIKDFGYANEGEYQFNISYGFYQGTIFSIPTKTGPRFAELINAFMSGIRLINPSGVTATNPPSAGGIIVDVE